MRQPSPLTRNQARWIMVVVLLLAAWLRWHHLSDMNDMLMFDEAHNGWDALRLLDEPRLTPFFPENNGRESGYHYWLLPFLATLSAQPFAIRLASTVAGVLTVAALYRLGTQLGDRHLGLWSAAALAVLFWHVHQSQIGLRAILHPLIGTLALAALLVAQRHGKQRDWIVGGLFLGLLSYTYFSARLWIAFAGLWLIWIWWQSPTHRKGSTIALLLTFVVGLPQLLYSILYPSDSLDRIQSVAVFSPPAILENSRRWLLAIYQTGDGNSFLNLSNRPIFDLPLGILFSIGLLSCLLIPKWRTTLLWLISLLLLSLLPSILSDFAPHFLRGQSAVIPLAILVGFGAMQISSIQPIRTVAWIVPLLLLGFSARQVVIDQQQWLQRGDRFLAMEMPVNAATSWLVDSDSTPGNLYYSPYAPYHPNVAYQSRRVNYAHLGAFMPDVCAVVPDGEAIYVNVPFYFSSFEGTMGQWADLELVKRADVEIEAGVPLFEIYRGESTLEGVLNSAENAPIFNQNLQVRHAPLPETVNAGDTLRIPLAFRALSQLPAVYSAFIHLHGSPSPYDGGLTYAQVDSWLCEPYPSTEWQPFETVVQEFLLTIPPDTPAGSYEIAIGLYESPAGARLTLTAPAPNPNNFFVIGTVEVNP